MDQLQGAADPFVRFVADSLAEGGLFLIDVGAAGGIFSAWRGFGNKLRGFGFDADQEEVSRLNAIEPAPGFRYVQGMVGLPRQHPFAAKRRGRPRITRNPWYRFAMSRWASIRQARCAGEPLPTGMRASEPSDAYYGENDYEYTPVIELPMFLQERGVGDVDFLKIDVDGADFDILQSMEEWYDKLNVLGIGVEVNFFGSNSDTVNTFHNVDRFLKNCQFELFDLSVRRYCMQDLPCNSIQDLPYPADTVFGRPFQGDAFYARDVCASGQKAFSERLNGEKLAKISALFSLFGLPDCAAEVFNIFRNKLIGILDVDRGLDFLARQAQPRAPNPLPYRQYIADFERRAYGNGGLR
jgi:hypothetical protein